MEAQRGEKEEETKKGRGVSNKGKGVEKEKELLLGWYFKREGTGKRGGERGKEWEDKRVEEG